MPLLDIATSQPSFQNHFCNSRLHTLLRGTTSVKFTFGKEKRLTSTWNVPIQIPKKVNFDMGHFKTRGALLIKAVATLEPKYLVQSDGHGSDLTSSLVPDSNPQVSQYPSEDSAETTDRERLRRMRISKSNKGNVPWNKGRKHSPETLQRIRERTRLAMQNPKVKEKLVNLGHAQSEETKKKIGDGVRFRWVWRHAKSLVQESCHFEWQNLIAEASRKGYAGEEEHQWYSYEVLSEQLEQEWLESIERRRSNPKPKDRGKRAPKPPEQRKKISEAIAAKWADPDYRKRVCVAMSRHHGTPTIAERRPKKKPKEVSELTRSRAKKKASETPTRFPNQVRSQLTKKRPAYMDPLVDTKFEMIKNIRAQREVIETKKVEAVDRAKLLIAEAEKAAKALEVAAMKSPLALAALMEARKLIAEATRSIEAAKAVQVTPPMVSKSDMDSSLDSFNEPENHHSSLESSNEQEHHDDDEKEEEDDQETVAENEGLSSPDKEEINGTHILSLGSNGSSDFDFTKFTLESLLNSEEPIEIYSKYHSPPTQLDPNNNNWSMNHHGPQYEQVGSPLQPNGVFKYQRMTELNVEETQVVQQSEKTETSSTDKSTKMKWIRGRLVEVTEEEEEEVTEEEEEEEEED